jgi:hypothetical protein
VITACCGCETTSSERDGGYRFVQCGGCCRLIAVETEKETILGLTSLQGEQLYKSDLDSTPQTSAS